jgi:hypothetical protein
VSSLRIYSLDEIFESAQNDVYSVRLDGLDYEAFLLYGIKVIRFSKSGNIQILNTLRNGEYYAEITTDEYTQFALNGWRLGVYDIAIKNYKDKLKSIDEKLSQDLLDRPTYTSSLLHQKGANIERLKKIEEKKWKAINTKSLAK